MMGQTGRQTVTRGAKLNAGGSVVTTTLNLLDDSSLL